MSNFKIIAFGLPWTLEKVLASEFDFLVFYSVILEIQYSKQSKQWPDKRKINEMQKLKKSDNEL